MADIRDDAGLTPSHEEPDEIREGTVVTGEGPADDFMAPAPDRPSPVSSWSEVDPDHTDLVDADDEPEDADDEDLDGDPAEGDPSGASAPRWVSYEVEGRDRDEPGSAWRPYLSAPLDEDSMSVTIPDLPTAVNLELRMRLTDSQGRHTKWTESVQVTTPRDFTPPPPPVAPWVHSELGHTTAGSTGELTGDRPVDHSHDLLYIQQMHPEGDESGDPGDPVSVARFVGAGQHTLGFLPFVEHRAFLTSVDTSRNESTRSEYAYFTPTQPVDREQIEADLESARDDLDEARTDFETGNAERKAEIDYLRDERIPSLEQTLAQGLSDEVTRLEDMITTAGGTTILRSTSAPSASDGEGLDEGTIWYRYDTLSSGGELEGMWTWDGSAWAESTIAEQVMAQVHLESGTYGSLSGERLEARSVSTEHLQVRSFDLIGDPNFETVSTSRQAEQPNSWWLIPGSGSWGTGGQEPQRETGGPDGSLIHWNNGGGSVDTRYWPVKGGETYAFRVKLDRWDGGRIATRYQSSPTSGYLSFGPDAPSIPTGGPDVREVTWTETVPDGVGDDQAYLGITFRPDGNCRILSVEARRATDGNLLVENAVKSRAVDTEEFFAANGVIDRLSVAVARAMEITAERGFIGGVLLEDETITLSKLTALDEIMSELGRFLRIEVDQLASNEIQGMSIQGGQVVGAEFRTRTGNLYTGAGAGLMNSSHLRGIGSGGSVNTELDFETGELYARGADLDGDITARSMDLSGELRVGGNGEGGIIPDGDRIRYVGRTPDASTPYDQVTHGRTGQLQLSTSRSIVQISYLSPSPEGARVPIISLHRTSGGGMDQPMAHTRNRSASGFDVYINATAGATLWVYYSAFWGDPPNSPGSAEAG
ncbi:hypothetical protein [Nesterenkonia populi]|uniref:hypothetical protein n=1 Tax=Nesterenkonia populi TaxID=1591087 RepID=UPI0011BDF4C1|nr:hypothetical protein [Nesterenkonia populi]